MHRVLFFDSLREEFADNHFLFLLELDDPFAVLNAAVTESMEGLLEAFLLFVPSVSPRVLVAQVVVQRI